MTSSQQTAEDIVQSLLNLDGVSEVNLIETAIGDLTDRDRKELIGRIKEENDFLTDDEAREKYEKEEDGE
jgi:Zn-dependent membrane protease YugP